MSKNEINASLQEATQTLDITSEVCPMTFVRTRLALDSMAPNETLLVKLKGEEPVQNVPRSAAEQGHELIYVKTDDDGISHLLIRRGK